MKHSKEQIYEIVAAAVARSLACELEEISAHASLVDDLGMDSLDFLDVIFSLEKSLKIKLLGGEINKLLRPDKSQNADQQDPYLSREEMERLAPFISALKDAADANEKILRLDLFKLVTTETLVEIVLSETKNKAE